MAGLAVELQAVWIAGADNDDVAGFLGTLGKFLDMTFFHAGFGGNTADVLSFLHRLSLGRSLGIGAAFGLVGRPVAGKAIGVHLNQRIGRVGVEVQAPRQTNRIRLNVAAQARAVIA